MAGRIDLFAPGLASERVAPDADAKAAEQHLSRLSQEISLVVPVVAGPRFEPSRSIVERSNSILGEQSENSDR